MSTRTIIGCCVTGAALLVACGDDATDRSALPLLATRATPAALDEPGAAAADVDPAVPASTDAVAPVGTTPADQGDDTAGSSAAATSPPAAVTTTTITPDASTSSTSVPPSTTAVGPTSTTASTNTASTTTAAATTSRSSSTTSTTTATIPPPIPTGLYRVPEEVGYGVYRAFPSWVTLDAEDVTVNSDVVDDCLTVMVVDERASFVEIEGEARRIEAFPTYDPIETGCTTGTFLVGPDVQPGQYRLLSIDGFAYWARLDATLEIIASDLLEADTIVTVAATDFALSYTGTLARMG